MQVVTRRFIGWSVLFPVLVGLSVGMVMAQGAGPDPFSDLPSSHWAYGAVRDLVGRGILDGYPDGTFRGKNLVTRYALAVTLGKALQELERGGATPRGGAAPMGASDLATLERLIKEFSDELAMLGVKTAALEERLRLHDREIDDLKVRVDRVEKGSDGAEDDRIFFDSGEIRIVGYNKEELDNFADTIMNLGFKVEDKVQGRLGLRYTSTFDQNLDNDTFDTYEAYADFANLGPVDRMRVGKSNVLLGTGITLFDRREGFLLDAERNDVLFQVGYFDAQFYHLQTTLLGDAKVGFYHILQDKVSDRSPSHTGLYARGTAGDGLAYEFELANYDNDGVSPGSALHASNNDDSTRAIHMGLSWRQKTGPLTAARFHYVDQEEDYRALAIDSDLRYHNKRFSPLEDVLQAVRDATPSWVDPDELNGFTDLKLGVDFDLRGSPWSGRFDWDMVREHSSRLNNSDDEFDVLTLAVTRELRRDCSLELRFQSIFFDQENGSAAVDTIPALIRQDRSNFRAQFYVKF